jgi:hypothetical protein
VFKGVLFVQNWREHKSIQTQKNTTISKHTKAKANQDEFTKANHTTTISTPTLE